MPYSDLAVISIVPANDLAKSCPFPLMPNMDILPPAVGEGVAAFGYADTGVTFGRWRSGKVSAETA